MTSQLKSTRRELLTQAAQTISAASIAGAGGWLSPGVVRGAEPRASMSVDVLLDEPIGTIKPALYGHFTEHIGGVVYDGIWVGPDSKVDNIDGIRRKLVEHMLRLGPTVIRWPGGCFADAYDWRDAQERKILPLGAGDVDLDLPSSEISVD